MLTIVAILACLQAAPEPRWRAELDGGLRFVDGRTRVREGPSLPAWLGLNDDLGMKAGVEAGLGVVRETRDSRTRIALNVFEAEGRGHLDVPFQFDEGPFLADLPFTVRTVFTRLTAARTWKRMFVDDGDAWLGPLVELRYDRGLMGIRQPGSTRGGSTENYNQFLPYPVLGVAGSWPLSSSSAFEFRAGGAWVPDLPTPYLEGGRVSMNIREAAADVAFRWSLSRSADLRLGAGYEYWRGLLRSHEDGNQLVLEGFRLEAALEFSW